MSRTTSATINYTLTSYAQGFMNDRMAIMAVIAALMPTVPVTGASGQYKKFDDRNMFTVYTTSRGLGGAAKRIEFNDTDAYFNCAPNALEAAVDDFEREQAGASNALAMELLDQGRIKALLNSTSLSHLNKAIAYILSKLTAVDARGNWSNENIDPIDQLDEQLEGLSTDVGMTDGITITMSTAAWRALRNHPKVKKRTTGVQISGISIDQLKGMLIFPVNVIVGAISKTSNAKGQAAVTKANIIGANAILSYTSANPTVYDPSPFKCFTTGQGMIDAVRTYRDEGARSDVHAVDWSEDMQQTSTLSARLLAIT